MEYKMRGKVELFPQPGGWVYIRVPSKVMKQVTFVPVRGLIPVTVTMQDSMWDTSLLPMGDGTHFIPLKASVRKEQGIEVGRMISLSFRVR